MPTYYSPEFITGQGANGRMKVCVYSCMTCSKETTDLWSFSQHAPTEITSSQVFPANLKKYVASEVPVEIAADFQEAHLCLSISLKASTTLARRCLQSILRHHFKDMPRKLTLVKEIDWLRDKGALAPQLIAALHSLREAGNFGAHPENDGLTMDRKIN